MESAAETPLKKGESRIDSNPTRQLKRLRLRALNEKQAHSGFPIFIRSVAA